MALLIAFTFFTFGFSWYYGQILLRRHLHCYPQTTALLQLSTRLGFSESTNELGTDLRNEELECSRSLLIDYQAASSDEDDETKSIPMINILPSLLPMNNNTDNTGLPFIDDTDENACHFNVTGNVVFTVTPGLGVFLTTSSRHTPHVFERVLERIHAVYQYLLDFILFLTFYIASTSSNLS